MLSKVFSIALVSVVMTSQAFAQIAVRTETQRAGGRPALEAARPVGRTQGDVKPALPAGATDARDAKAVDAKADPARTAIGGRTSGAASVSQRFSLALGAAVMAAATAIGADTADAKVSKALTTISADQAAYEKMQGAGVRSLELARLEKLNDAKARGEAACAGNSACVAGVNRVINADARIIAANGHNTNGIVSESGKAELVEAYAKKGAETINNYAGVVEGVANRMESTSGLVLEKEATLEETAQYLLKTGRASTIEDAREMAKDKAICSLGKALKKG